MEVFMSEPNIVPSITTMTTVMVAARSNSTTVKPNREFLRKPIKLVFGDNAGVVALGPICRSGTGWPGNYHRNLVCITGIETGRRIVGDNCHGIGRVGGGC